MRLGKHIPLALLVSAIAAAAAAAGAAAKTSFVIKGRGFGHGIGMSQYGAYGMALNGWTYRQILGHYYTGTGIGSAQQRRVRVLLAAGRASVTVQGAAAANGRRLDPGRSYRAVPSGTAVKLRTQAGKRVGTFEAPLGLTGPSPKAVAGPALNGVSDGRYRGTIEIRPAGTGGLNVINSLGLESYVAGVVPAEVPASWSQEVLKAQAVGARSYALATNVNGPGFEQYPDTRSQVYRGLAGEHAASTEATRATAGEVVTFAGAIVPTFFFSTSGGRTENIENSFLGSDPRPYLVSVDDPYDNVSPFHAWGPYRYRPSVLGRKLGAKGSLRAVNVIERGRSPRIVRAQIVGSDGTSTLTGPAIRARLGLRDTWVYFERVTTRTQQPPTGGTDGRSASRAAGMLVGSVDPAPVSGWVTIQRRVGHRWRTFAQVRLDGHRRYRAAVPAGVYRVVAGWAPGDAVRVRR